MTKVFDSRSGVSVNLNKIVHKKSMWRCTLFYQGLENEKNEVEYIPEKKTYFEDFIKFISKEIKHEVPQDSTNTFFQVYRL
mgnify:CR=1 FL=1